MLPWNAVDLTIHPGCGERRWKGLLLYKLLRSETKLMG